MITFPKRYLARTAAFLAVATIAGCQSSDKIPPKGATITVAANPATIPIAAGADCLNLLRVSSCGTADVVATVASELGVPLPGQDVRFSSTAGFLYTGSASSPVNAANIPIRTDRFGNSSVKLITAATATVSAKSGAASGTLTINTVTGNLNAILLSFDLSSTGCNPSFNLTTCSQILCFTAKAVDANGVGIQGVVLNFAIQNNVLNGNTLAGNFSPSPITTDSTGSVSSQFQPDVGTCPTQCSAAQSKSCAADAIVTTTGGGFQSNTKHFTVIAP
jgi:hypothetical protein